MSGHGEGHAGPETNESDPGLAPSECFDSMFDFEQWEADQEVHWELHQDLQGLSNLASSGDEGLNITSLTPQSSSIDFDLEEPLRTTTPVSTIVPTTVSANIESLSCLGVPSWDFVSITDHNSISLPSTHLVHSPDIASGTDGAEVPLRQQSLPSGYSGDYSNQTTGDHNAFSKDPSVERQSDVGVGVGSYVIQPKQSLPHSKKGSRTKSRRTISTKSTQLTTENVTSYDCSIGFRSILPRLDAQGTPCNHTEPDAQASSSMPPKKKRKPNTDEDREKIKLVRRGGACLRCRIFKEACDQNKPCGRCLIALANAKVFSLPCYREPLENVIAFRAGNSRAGKIRSEPISIRWAGDDISPRVVALSYPFKKQGAGAGLTVTIKCRKFVPYEWDVMEEPWSISPTKSIPMISTPFACYDDGASVAAVARYIEATKAALLDESLDGILDDMIRLSTAEATRYCLKYRDSAVATAMNIRAASFFSRTKMIMTGNNVLELPYFHNPHFLLNGGYPVPSMIDYQMDYMAITYMHRQMEVLVKQLKKLIFTKNQRKSWYEVYLTVFVLLQSLETVHARQIDIIRRYEPEGGEALSKARNIGTRMIDEWKYSARILIYHYRAVLKGMVPFAATWNDKHVAELRHNCGLDEEALQYARQMSGFIRTRFDSLRRLTKEGLDNDAVRPLAWIARLYIDDEVDSGKK